MKILLLGSCQMMSYETLMRAAGLTDITVLRFNETKSEHLDKGWYDRFDMVFTHNETRSYPETAQAVRGHRNVVLAPVLIFNGFNPDDEINVTLRPGAGPGYMSKIANGAFRNNLSKDEAIALYNPEFCDLLGYPQTLDKAKHNLLARFSPIIPNFEQLYWKWYASGPFFYTANHPKLLVVEDVLREVLRGQKNIEIPSRLSEICVDPLREYTISPQMNHPAVLNLLTDPKHLRRDGSRTQSCGDFVNHSYNTLEKSRETVVYDPNANKVFDAALTKWRARRPVGPVANPYKSQPSRAFWSRTVARPAQADVSPIGHAGPVIGRTTKVATAGSCFAQHVARAMVADGLTYHVAEQAPAGMDAATADERGYGLFSARYGNIYSSRQLLQLIQRAYGEFDPIETAWPVEGGYVDPFRPNIGETFETPQAIATARAAHLATVRKMFEDLEVFVFTMGLTEGWIDRRDGAAFPVAPAAISSAINPANFGFINSDYANVQREMLDFLAFLGRVNPTAKVVLTVSPVPLIATFTDSDVLSATTYSKSVLRAVAGDLATQLSNVSYFPSFEIITGAHARGAYFAGDLRSVRPEGVEHVMRVFRDVLVIGDGTEALAPDVPAIAEPDADYLRQASVVCDEEMLIR